MSRATAASPKSSSVAGRPAGSVAVASAKNRSRSAAAIPAQDAVSKRPGRMQFTRRGANSTARARAKASTAANAQVTDH